MGTEDIWLAREELSEVAYAARALLVSPWALLGNVLTRSLATIPHTVRYRSSFRPKGAPLNLINAQAGASGAGKTVLDETAGMLFAFEGFHMPPTETPRSGEGIAASIGHMVTTERDGKKVPELRVNRPDFRSYREPCPADAGWPDSGDVPLNGGVSRDRAGSAVLIIPR